MLFVPSTFLPDLMHEFGRSSQDVYISLMAMGVGDLSARLLFGFLVQKIPRKLAFIRSAGAMLSCVASCLITRSRSLLMFAIFSGLIGVSIGKAYSIWKPPLEIRRTCLTFFFLEVTDICLNDAQKVVLSTVIKCKIIINTVILSQKYF
jgi:predicted MFS family arabinose efflux permease